MGGVVAGGAVVDGACVWGGVDWGGVVVGVAGRQAMHDSVRALRLNLPTKLLRLLCEG